MDTVSPIGRPLPRVDGPLKVSGPGLHSDHHFPGLLFAVPVRPPSRPALWTGSTPPSPGRCPACARSTRARPWASISGSPQCRISRCRLTSSGSRLKTTSSDTTANMSPSPWRRTLRKPRLRRARCGSPIGASRSTSATNSRSMGRWPWTASAGCGKGVRRSPGQGRPDLRHPH